MQEDFHYYATYCAAVLAGYSHDECMDICYSAQFVDHCSVAYLNALNAPRAAATTMQQMEMMDSRTDIIGLQEITRIWSAFHFLPRDIKAEKKWRTRRYINKYRLICGPKGELVKKTVELAKDRPVQSVGIAMHVLADTWAHANFAGTPSLVINNTTDDFYEIIDSGEKAEKRLIKFRHSTSVPDDLEHSIYTNSLYQRNENSIMNLGHGRAGHLPDYSFVKYWYLPAWNDYREIVKDNPSDYFNAFCQMVYAMRFLRGDIDAFDNEQCDEAFVSEHEERIREIIGKRRLDASDDWKEFGESLSWGVIKPFDIGKYREEYLSAGDSEKESTFLGRFFKGAIAHKWMVCDSIFRSGNLLTGYVQGPEVKAK